MGNVVYRFGFGVNGSIVILEPKNFKQRMGDRSTLRELQRFCLRLKLHKVKGTVVQHNALLAREVKGKLVQGYVLCENQACWHCWVEKDGERLDVTHGMSLPVEYVQKIPDGYTEMKHANIILNKLQYELYENDPKAFWKECPKF
jgi:hypothetical protein